MARVLLWGNTFGAVLGCLLAGFYLLRLYDVSIATYAAVGLNIIVALIALWLARLTTYEGRQQSEQMKSVRMSPGSSSVLIVIALSGMTALGAEVVWTRLLTLNFGGTTYTFSLILASFLVGIGIGSAAGSVLARYIQNARNALGWTQFLVVLGLAWAAARGGRQ